MKNIKYLLFGVVGCFILLMSYAKIYYYVHRYNELMVVEDLLSGKKIKCNEVIYQLDKEHYLTMFSDEIGRNGKSMTIMKKKNDTTSSGNSLYRCEIIEEQTFKGITTTLSIVE